MLNVIYLLILENKVITNSWTKDFNPYFPFLKFCFHNFIKIIKKSYNFLTYIRQKIQINKQHEWKFFSRWWDLLRTNFKTYILLMSAINTILNDHI